MKPVIVAENVIYLTMPEGLQSFNLSTPEEVLKIFAHICIFAVLIHGKNRSLVDT